MFELELDLDQGEGDILNANYLGYAFTEPYDDSHLWFWSQIELDRTLEDMSFWESISEALANFDIDYVPSSEELLEMTEHRLEEGNTEGFENRLG